MTRQDFNDAAPLHRWEVANDMVPVDDMIQATEARRQTSPDFDQYRPVFETPRASRFTVEDFDTLKPSPQAWRVKGLFPSVGVQIIAGPSMAGKSFLALHVLATICTGRRVFGLKSKLCGGVYFASEDAAGVRTRIVGLRTVTGPLGGTFEFVGSAPNLCDVHDLADVRTLIEARRDHMAERGIALGVVVIDTLSASIPGADENSAKDMSPVLAELQKIAQDFGLLIILVAHTGKDEGRGVRGWSGLKGNADGVILVEAPNGDGTRVVTVDKVKNGPSGARFGMVLKPVPLGFDEDGDAIETCVVEETEAPDRPRGGRKPTKAMASAELIRAAFNRIFEERAVPISAAGANGAKGVSVSDLRAEAYLMGLGPSEPDYGECPDSASFKACKRRWQDQRKSDFDRGRDHLVGTRQMRIEGVMIWPLGA
ncbi:AAA family ATPase [Phenylobacterium sp.]|uniref:AAA family ATPase n=1 Tax=Phenylobacterium sp. TaxID=1871053 RepID=UPI00374D04D7